MTGLAYDTDSQGTLRVREDANPVTASRLAARARIQVPDDGVKEEEQFQQYFDAKPPRFLEYVQRIRDERQGQYGPPAEHWAKTVAMLNALGFERSGKPLSSADWAEVMIVDKLARGLQAVRDSRLDVAGYADGLDEVLRQG